MTATDALLETLAAALRAILAALPPDAAALAAEVLRRNPALISGGLPSDADAAMAEEPTHLLEVLRQ
jgi:hypothetical protein